MPSIQYLLYEKPCRTWSPWYDEVTSTANRADESCILLIFVERRDNTEVGQLLVGGRLKKM